ncbi:MAG: hypothetical protein IT326_07800 [Anaerolineae bacterium]|nr:hypothetical protein [Anaerolineae bacterium]
MAEEVKSQREEPEFVTHAKAAGKAVYHQWNSLIPAEFWEHRREAKREALLALRSLVDAAINRLEPQGDAEPRRTRSTPRKAKVEVE